MSVVLDLVIADCAIQMDVAFVLDTSSSVGLHNLRLALEFIHQIVEKLDFVSGKARVALVTFSDHGLVQFNLNSYHTKKEVLEAIFGARYSIGGTYTADALKMTRDSIFTRAQGDRSDYPNKAIVITDGVSNILPQRTLPEARNLQRAGVEMFTVGIGVKNTKELRRMASRPTNVFLVDTFAQLENTTDVLLQKLCFDRSALEMETGPDQEAPGDDPAAVVGLAAPPYSGQYTLPGGYMKAQVFV